MRALLKPLKGHGDVETVELVARTGGDKITVRHRKGYRAHHRFLLTSASTPGQRITKEEFAALPWRGTGPDPEATFTEGAALFDDAEAVQ